MIRVRATLIGLRLAGRWVERRSPVVIALLRIVLVVLVFGFPLAALRWGAMTYSDVWWWLWLDAAIVGGWAIVMMRAQRVSPFTIAFMVAHYFVVFMLFPAISAHRACERTAG